MKKIFAGGSSRKPPAKMLFTVLNLVTEDDDSGDAVHGRKHGKPMPQE
jgi:hypothetical protein